LEHVLIDFDDSIKCSCGNSKCKYIGILIRMVPVSRTAVLICINLCEVIMNKIRFVVDVVDKIIVVAKLIRDTAELRNKEIENNSGERESKS
jgi:hypothetical protein